MTMQYEWRKIKRKERQVMSNDERLHASQLISEKILKKQMFVEAKHIACYLPLAEEVDVMPIIKAAFAAGKKVYLPVVIERGEALKFAPYTHSTLLTSDSLGMSVPDVPSTLYFDAEQLDIVITPLVCFDENKNRVGMGGGFYDRTFSFRQARSKTTPTLIGVAFELQKVPTLIDVQPWDIPLDIIVTEKN